MKTRENATTATRKNPTTTLAETRGETRVATREAEEVAETVSISAVMTNHPALRLHPSRSLSTRRKLQWW